MGIEWGALLVGALLGALVGYWRSTTSPAHGNAVNPVAGGSVLGGLSA